MTETDWEALGRRAVACKGWRWVAGMKSVGGCHECECYVSDMEGRGYIPDLRDPATLGCLVALVREAWGAVRINPPEADDPVPDVWEVERLSDDPPRPYGWLGATEAEALVAALEGAP